MANKHYKVGRNSAMDWIILLPMLFMSFGGFYLLIEGSDEQLGIGLLMGIICPIVAGVFLVKIIRNKPIIILSEKGIYLKSIGRTIAWSDVGNLRIEEEDITHKESPGAGLEGIKKYLIVFEITNRKEDGDYGFDRRECTNYTDHTANDLLQKARNYWREYR